MARPRIGDERRQEILSAFEACVVRKGFAKTTLTDVAEQAGQPRSLVRYFIGNRADMVNALIERLLEKGEAQFRQLPRDGETRDTLNQLLNAIFADDTSNIVIMELWHLALRDETLRKRLAAIYQRVMLEVAALVGEDASSDNAHAAVSLAFGSAFFGHLGLAPNSPDNIRMLSHRILTLDAPTLAGAFSND